MGWFSSLFKKKSLDSSIEESTMSMSMSSTTISPPKDSHMKDTLPVSKDGYVSVYIDNPSYKKFVLERVKHALYVRPSEKTDISKEIEDSVVKPQIPCLIRMKEDRLDREARGVSYDDTIECLYKQEALDDVLEEEIVHVSSFDENGKKIKSTYKVPYNKKRNITKPNNSRKKNTSVISPYSVDSSLDTAMNLALSQMALDVSLTTMSDCSISHSSCDIGSLSFDTGSYCDTSSFSDCGSMF